VRSALGFCLSCNALPWAGRQIRCRLHRVPCEASIACSPSDRNAVELKALDCLARGARLRFISSWISGPQYLPSLGWINNDEAGPIARDGRLYARGASAVKGSTTIAVEAVAAFLAVTKHCPVNVKFKERRCSTTYSRHLKPIPGSALPVTWSPHQSGGRHH